MKAVQYERFGDPDVLHVVDVREPHAGPGQIRVAVRAAGVNPIDWKLRSGAFDGGKPLDAPRIPGAEVAGDVDEVGDGVTGVAVGDTVFGLTGTAGYAEYAVLEHFAAKPAAMSWAEAAGLPVSAETAVRALDLLGVRGGETVLINGAAGGVGAAATQFALGRGAVVIGTASEANHDYLRELGATPVSYGDGLVERVRAVAPDGVNLALDTAGRGALPDLIELAGGPENVLTIADPTAAEHKVRFSAGGSDDRAYHALAEVAKLYADGRFAIPAPRTFPLDQAPQAHRLSEAGHGRGKVVLLTD